jgi:hypothetical protein
MTNQFPFQQSQFEFTRTNINVPQMMLIFLDEIFFYGRKVKIMKRKKYAIPRTTPAAPPAK